MRKFHPFYFIGTFGVMVTGLFHLFFSLALSINAHTLFFTQYILFAVFLFLGLRMTLKAQKLQEQ